MKNFKEMKIDLRIFCKIKLIGILILLTLSICVTGQTTKLEKKSGFRTYILGSEFKNYEKELDFTKSALQGKARIYQKKDKITLFQYSAELSLTFIEDKLAFIDLKLQDVTEDNFEGIYQELRKVYGDGEEFGIYEVPKYYKLESGDRIYMWNSKLVLMEFQYRANQRVISLTIWSVTLSNKVAESEF